MTSLLQEPIPDDIITLTSVWTPLALVSTLSFLTLLATFLLFRSSTSHSWIPIPFLVFTSLAVTLLTSVMLPADLTLPILFSSSSSSSEYETRREIGETIRDVHLILTGIVLLLPLASMLLLEVWLLLRRPESFGMKICRAMSFLAAPSLFLLLIGGSVLSSSYYKHGDNPPGGGVPAGLLAFCDVVYCGVHAFLVFLVALMMLSVGSGMSSLPLGMMADLWKKMRGSNDNKDASATTEGEKGELEEEEHARRLKKDVVRRICCRRTTMLQIIFSVALALFGLLFFTSVLLNVADIHLNPHARSFLLPSSICRPMEKIFFHAKESLYPLDYHLYLLAVGYLVACSAYEIRNLANAIRQKIHTSKTKQQVEVALMCLIVILVISVVNVLMFSVVPDYLTNGSQYFRTNETINNVTMDVVGRCESSSETIPADCELSKIAHDLLWFSSMPRFISVSYRGLVWFFLATMVVGFVMSVYRVKRALDRKEKDEIEEDEEDRGDGDGGSNALASINVVDEGGIGDRKEKESGEREDVKIVIEGQ